MTDGSVPQQPAQQPAPAPEIPDEVQALRDFIAANGRFISFGFLALVIACSAIFLYVKHQEKARLKASEVLFAARSPEDMEKGLAEYGTSPQAPLAIVRLAKMHYDQANYDAAQQKYESLLRTHPDTLVAPIASLGRIHCIEAKGASAEALNLYTEFIKAHPESYLLAQALMGKARCHEALDDLQNARVQYEDILVRFPKTGWTALAEEMIETIDRKRTRTTQAAPATPPAAAPDVTPAK